MHNALTPKVPLRTRPNGVKPVFEIVTVGSRICEDLFVIKLNILRLHLVASKLLPCIPQSWIRKGRAFRLVGRMKQLPLRKTPSQTIA